MRRLLRILQIANYLLMAFSIMLIGGAAFGSSFVDEFTVMNRTNQAIAFTPVGVHNGGARPSRLRTIALRWLALPAFRSGGFQLAPGESRSILYDAEHVRASDIIVEDASGRMVQLAPDPPPTIYQFVVRDLSALPPATEQLAAIHHDQGFDVWGPTIFYAILLGPWPFYIFSIYAIVRIDRRKKLGVETRA